MDQNLTSARREALSACTNVEDVGSAMASMPYYMAQGVNELSAKGIEKAINGLMSMLLLTVTGVEEIVLFIINLLTSTYVCLITFAVGGSLHVAIDIAEVVGDALNTTIKAVGADLGTAVDDFQTAMNKFLKAIDDVASFISGDDVTVPTIDLNSSIATLDSLQLPSGYDKELITLNDSIPTFAQVQNLTTYVIELPFEEIKKLLNESMGGKYTMNSSIFPIPSKEKLTFCSDNNGIEDFFDDLVKIERLAKKIFLIVIIVAALLACIPMGYKEIRGWRFMKDRAEVIRNTSRDPMESVYLVSRPYTADAGLKIAGLFSSTRSKILARWTIAYATTLPALFVLALAIAGLLGCLCQYILLKAVEKEVPALTLEVEEFADKVVAALDNASVQWAVGVNDVINSTNTKINDDVFGWVNTTTHALNETLNVFVNGTMDVLNVTFGGTILYEPVLDVLNCLLLLKIKGIEKGLTWVSDNAHIDFPMLQNDTFSLGMLDKLNNDSSSNSSILTTGSNSSATDEISSAVAHVTNALADAIRQETIISSCVLLVWFLIFFVGFFRAGFLMVRSDEDVYIMQTPPPRPKEMPQEEHDHLDGFFQTKDEPPNMASVPTYEQATSISEPGDNSANKYNGQTYTLAPRRFPDPNLTSETSPILSSGFSPSEKVGFVGSQNVEAATRRPAHIRASSYANFGHTTPVEQLPPPPLPPAHTKGDFLQNPFADHAQ